MTARWWQFTRERFDPLSHLLMIAVFVEAHEVMTGTRIAWGRNAAVFALLFAATTLFFFKLRLYDEIKDYELDCVINPTRPLARGLVSHRDLHIGIAACIAAELALFAFVGGGAALAVALPILYSLLMYKEFFIREKIRPHLTTYAVSHTVVSGMFSLALISALTGRPLWELGRAGYLFALNSWCLFNIFEFGRKTFTSAEERPNVDSYSRIFGRYGAVMLVLSQSAVSAACLVALSADARSRIVGCLAAANVALLLFGAGYAILNRSPYGKLYRAYSSAYIVVIYLGFVLIR